MFKNKYNPKINHKYFSFYYYYYFSRVKSSLKKKKQHKTLVGIIAIII